MGRHFRSLKVLAALALFSVAGCCGTQNYTYSKVYDDVSFNVGVPTETAVSPDRQEVRLPVSVTNTSSGPVCFARFKANQWVGGLKPVINVDPGTAPIELSEADVVLVGLEGQTLERGRTISNAEEVFLRIRPQGTAPVGASGTLQVSVGLQRADTPTGDVSAAEFPIDVVIRPRGRLALISEPISFNSERRDQ